MLGTTSVLLAPNTLQPKRNTGHPKNIHGTIAVLLI